MAATQNGVKKLEFNEEMFNKLFEKRGYVSRFEFLTGKKIVFRFSDRYPTDTRTAGGRIVIVFKDKPAETWQLTKINYGGRTLGLYGSYFMFFSPVGRVYFMADTNEEFSLGFAYTLKGILELIILEAGIDVEKLEGIVVDVLVLPKGWKHMENHAKPCKTEENMQNLQNTHTPA
jgi:hypothetical protein